MWEGMATFSYSQLRNLERQERQSPELMNVGNDFYEAVRRHIRELEERLEEERARDPSSKKVLLISDELRNTRRIWDSIFERREKKVVQAALSAARSGSHTPKHMTSQEKEFYRRLVDILEENRRVILEGEEVTPQPEAAEDRVQPGEDPRCQPEAGKGPAGKKGEPSPAPVTGVVLRITKDVPSFVGSDMKNYSLKEEDVVTLPRDMADILVKRGAAEKITVAW